MKQIIAMGGGGFSMEPNNPLLDTYLLEQSGSQNPKVCFVPTASGDADGYIHRFYEAFTRYECKPSHLSLFNLPTRDLEDYVLDKDIIYVGGGNTINMLVLWKEWNLEQYLRRAWENGVVLAGLSAGSLCWFEEGVTDSYSGDMERLDCLGFLRGSHCPHYDGEAERRPSYQRLIQSGHLRGGKAADDGVALHYHNDELYRVVSSRPNARAYDVDIRDGKVIETEIVPDYLGAEN